MKRIWKWLKRIALSLLVLMVLVATCAAVWHSRRTRVAEQNNPPTGDFVDVGGHKLHYVVRGKGSPIVVMNSGLGEAGFVAWFGVEEKISEFARVCTYDRAGLGWSEVGPSPRSCERQVEELRELLRKAGLPSPYILVGHSLGGYHMRFFASVYPKDVAGLILVDAFNTDTLADDAPIDRPFLSARFIHATRHFGAARVAYNSIHRDVKRVLEPHRLRRYIDMQSRGANFETLCEEWRGQSNWLEVRSQMRNLGNLPVTVISARTKSSGTQAARQEALAKAVGNNVEVIKPGCGHWVQMERPDVIVEAVLRMLERIRDN